MPICNRLILSFCLASGCAIGCSSSFIAPARTSLRSLPTLTQPQHQHVPLPLPSSSSSNGATIAWRLFGRKGGGGGKKEKKISKSNLPEKDCVVCGRPFTWRKKWERCWDEVTCCSKSCNAQRKSLAKES